MPGVSEHAEVLAANEAFYAAFTAHDPEAMDELWSRRAPCACIHPGWNALVGRNRVMASWRAIFEAGGAPPVQPTQASAHVLGATAYVVCLENLPGATLVATNIFVREDGVWRIVHHQAAPIAHERVERVPDPEPDEDPDPDPGTMLN